MKLTYDSVNDSPEKLPTFRQWAKLGELKPEVHLVNLIWFPGTYRNYTFVTEKFRLNINHDSKLFEALEMFVHEAMTNDLAIYVCNATAEGSYSLEHHERERCEWEVIGDSLGCKIKEMLTPVPKPCDVTGDSAIASTDTPKRKRTAKRV